MADFLQRPDLRQTNEYKMNLSGIYNSFRVQNLPQYNQSVTQYDEVNKSFVDNEENLLNLLNQLDSVNVFLLPIGWYHLDCNCIKMFHSCFHYQQQPNRREPSDNESIPFIDFPSDYDTSDGEEPNYMYMSFGEKSFGPLVRIGLDEVTHRLEKEEEDDDEIDVELLFVPNLEEMVDQYIFGRDFNRNRISQAAPFSSIRARNNRPNRRSAEEVARTYPNCYFLHPKYLSHGHTQFTEEPVNANWIAHYVIQYELHHQEITLTEDQYPIIFRSLLDCYPLLVYLWLVGNGYGFGLLTEFCTPESISEELDYKILKHRHKMCDAFYNTGNIDR